MTTAHRPTWKAAVGRSDEGGWSAGGASGTAISALDVASHTTLKTRQGPQIVDKRQALIQQSLLDLERAERTKKGRSSKGLLLPKRQYDHQAEEQSRQKLLKQTADCDDAKIKAKYDDSDVDDGGGSGSDSETDLDDDDDGNKTKKKKGGGNGDSDEEEESDLDASDSDDDDSSDSDSDDDDDDDEAALQAELEKIRAEREKVKQIANAKLAAEENAQMEEAALLGNPLLNAPAGGVSSTSNRRRGWNDDVVFRNQAKSEPALKKRFINDTVRNDFHRRFLNKFIR